MTLAITATSCCAAIGNGGFWGLTASANNIIPLFGCFIVGWRCSVYLAILVSVETLAFYAFGRFSFDPEVQSLELIILLSYLAQPFIVAGASWFIVHVREEMVMEIAQAAQRKIKLVSNM